MAVAFLSKSSEICGYRVDESWLVSCEQSNSLLYVYATGALCPFFVASPPGAAHPLFQSGDPLWLSPCGSVYYSLYGCSGEGQRRTTKEMVRVSSPVLSGALPPPPKKNLVTDVTAREPKKG